MMASDLQARHPGVGVPEAVRDAAVRAGRHRRSVDPQLLRRVRDALVRLPDSALGRHYFEIPGDCLASPAPVSPKAQRHRTSKGQT
jgi:hypothetical protein